MVLSWRRAGGGERVAGEIERSRDQDARPHLVSQTRKRAQRRFDGSTSLDTHAESACGARQAIRRHRVVALRYRHRDDVPGQPGKISEESARILIPHHADDDHERTRDPFLEITQRRRGDAPALGIAAAIEPYLASVRG